MSREQGSALWEALVAAALLGVAVSSIMPMATALQHHQQQGRQQRDAHQQALSLAAALASGRTFQPVHRLESAWWHHGVACFSTAAPVRLRDIRWRSSDGALACDHLSPEVRVLTLDT